MNDPRHKYECVMAYVRMSPFTYENASCHMYGWVMSNIYEWVLSHICACVNFGVHWVSVMSCTWISHVTHMDESCHTYGWVMSHIWMSHVTHTDESCRPCKRVNAHILMSHAVYTCVITTYIGYGSCHTCEEVMPHLWMRSIARMNMGWLRLVGSLKL